MTTVVEQLLRHDRIVIGTGLILICLLAWIYVLTGAGTDMSTLAMTTWQFPPPIHTSEVSGTWDTQYWAIMTLMWWIMMIAMMIPSATPMILLYARVYRQAQKQGKIDSPIIPTTAFAGGYLMVWLVFSLVAVCLQWLLEQVGMIDAMMMWSTHAVLSGSFLLAAGVYQLTSLKSVCLQQCRSPVQFITRNWHDSAIGATRMGIIHGAYCVGCCWVIMALLFVGGIMNLVWIAGLAIFVLLEKLLPQNRWFERSTGALLISAGGWVLLQ